MSLKKKMMLLLCLTISFTLGTKQRTITIYTIGDSTMSTIDSTQETFVGWAAVLSQYFTSTITVENDAVSGHSSKSFITEGLWTAVINKVQSGDYVFIQFTHNDESDDTSHHTDPWTTFTDNLTKFITETRTKGGNPVLCTPIVRRLFSDSTISAIGMHNTLSGDSLGNYPRAMRAVARKLNVPLIDLTLKTKVVVESYGSDSSKKIYNYVAAGVSSLYPYGHADDTHLSRFGATLVCALAIEGLKEIGSPLVGYLIISQFNNTEMVTTYTLFQNYPNPFNPSTKISFNLRFRSFVSLKIFDILGREVATLIHDELSSGNYARQWNASNMTSGIYFYRLSAIPSARRDLVPTAGREGQTGTFTETKKLVLLR
jgi:lysophospholipase L1-like esterase